MLSGLDIQPAHKTLYIADKFMPYMLSPYRGMWIYIRRIRNIDKTKDLINTYKNIVSIVQDQETANTLSQLLNIKIYVNRTTEVKTDEDDAVLVFQPKQTSTDFDILLIEPTMYCKE